ncbi:MAG TPA: SDR family oxidoreductase [Verrucomicrobiae bacterium]|jgi:nucleoside-diphosphate-sugar epimerase|nr:SDR family oxidoreductase [Verrucomicrobiae bacterium]
MRILLVGSEGYLGSLLGPMLSRDGHDVTGLDTGFYREGTLYRYGGTIPKTISKDVRQIEIDDLRGIEAVVHLGELSNDPLGQLSPDITYDINHKGSVRLAQLARQAGVCRFVYMSSCSVYGVSDAEFVDEQSRVDPQTAYAVCKVRVEKDVSELAAETFSPVFMRNATAYGASPHMRFDIVLNNLSGLAWTTGEIRMTSDGTPWRPLVHGLDICEAIRHALLAPREAIHNQIFNVGATNHNYRVREIAEIVAETFAGCKLTFGAPSADNRSYRVSFDKIGQRLPEFRCSWDARRGAQQLHDLFKRIDMTREMFGFRTFTRLKQLEHLIRTNQIDGSFYWKQNGD